MKIFIWNKPYGVPYGGSFLFIAAETEEQAREIAKTTPVISYGSSPPDSMFGEITLGEPTRVIDCPGGECYEWSE